MKSVSFSKEFSKNKSRKSQQKTTVSASSKQNRFEISFKNKRQFGKTRAAFRNF